MKAGCLVIIVILLSWTRLYAEGRTSEEEISRNACTNTN